MINSIIRLLKKIPFLYNLAKKVNSILNKKNTVAKNQVYIIHYGFILKNLEELEAIKEKYKSLQKYNTKLFVLVDNPSYNIIMHKLIKENPDISFASFDYFKRYHAKFSNYRVMWLNYTDADSELLDYLA